MTLKVLLCDELPIIRDGLRTLLELEPDIEVVDAVESGVQAMICIRSELPHVVVTGLTLRGMSGLELIRRIQREDLDPRPRVVVFAMNDSDEMVTDVLHAGVNGLLVKSATRADLSSAVRAAAEGYTTLAPCVAHRLVDWFRRREAVPHEVLRPQVAALTSRERQVLTLVARGMSTEDVAEELSIGVTTVRTHVYRLRTKLDVRDRAQLVSFAYRAGLMQPA
ncbi:MAG: response regulator [Frankiaceae bacterium]